MIYVASPYTHHKPAVRQIRMERARAYTAKLMTKGHLAFSPIVYGHEMAIEHNLPTTAEYWERLNFTFLAIASELHVLMLGDWKASVGIDAEIREAARLELPIKYIEV